MSAANHQDPDFDRILGEAARSWQQEHGLVTAHPDADTLIAYQEGTLPEDEVTRVRGHLVACEDCQNDLRALSAFDETPEIDDDASETARLEAGWQAFAAEREVRSESRPEQARRPPGSILALAASILFAVIGVASFMSSPKIVVGKPLVLDLSPDGAAIERTATAQKEFRVPAAVDYLVPRVRVGDQTPYERFELVLTDADGLEVTRLDDAVRDDEGRFALTVPRRDTPAGDYRLALFGLEGDRRIELAVYSFSLRDVG